MSAATSVAARPVLSPPMISTWLTCPLLWKGRYFDRVKRHATAAMVVGSAVHTALEAFHKSLWLGLPRPIESLVEIFVEDFRRRLNVENVDVPPKSRETLQTRGTELVRVYADRFKAEKVSAAELHLQCELIDPETGENLGCDLQGYVDAVIDGRIVDIKVNGAEKDIFSTAVMNGLQLSSYRYLTERSAPDVPVRGIQIRSLVRRAEPEIVVHNLPMVTDHRALFRVVRAYLDGIKTPAIPRPSFMCGPACDATKLCSDFHGFGEGRYV